jgi:hypothetical protein
VVSWELAKVIELIAQYIYPESNLKRRIEIKYQIKSEEGSAASPPNPLSGTLLSELLAPLRRANNSKLLLGNY